MERVKSLFHYLFFLKGLNNMRNSIVLEDELTQIEPLIKSEYPIYDIRNNQGIWVRGNRYPLLWEKSSPEYPYYNYLYRKLINRENINTRYIESYSIPNIGRLLRVKDLTLSPTLNLKTIPLLNSIVNHLLYEVNGEILYKCQIEGIIDPLINDLRYNSIEELFRDFFNYQKGSTLAQYLLTGYIEWVRDTLKTYPNYMFELNSDKKSLYLMKSQITIQHLRYNRVVERYTTNVTYI